MKILSGPSSPELGKLISENLNIPHLELDYKYFTDGETYLRVKGEFEQEEVVIVQNTFPNQEKSLLELMFLSATLKELGAAKIIAIIPYLSYARADRRREEGEVISHKISMQLLQFSGIDSILTLNVHNREAFSQTTPEMEKYDLSALPIIIEWMRDKADEDLLVIGPDKGVTLEVQELANGLDAETAYLDKFRDPVTHKITMKDTGFECKGRDVLLFDDIVTSGGTIKEASRIIIEKDPKSLTLVIIHALSTEEIFKDIKQLGVERIISTNTINREDIEQIDISKVFSIFIEDKFL